MRISIMTDMEGVCGIVDMDNWCVPGGAYYDEGKKLLTKEINAAAEGFFEAGATEIYVVDGHGCGGINHLILDNRCKYARLYPGVWPFTLDEGFDVTATIGQHAMARTEFAHLAHTGTFHVFECTINDIPVGEYGQLIFCAQSLGITPIFASGDEAFTKEAKKLVKGIETVAVKRGLTPGRGDECSLEEYAARNLSAIHIHPEKARELIKEGAYKSLKKYIEKKDSFKVSGIKAPCKRVMRFRPSAEKPAFTIISEHSDSIIKLLNDPGKIVAD